MRFVSYNIQYGTGKDGRIDLRRIAGEIGDADVVALQEVERHNSTTGMVDQAAELASLFPDHYWVYGAGVDLDASERDADGRLVNRRRQFGNMLLSRTPILSSRNHLLPKYGMVDQLALQRSALEGVIDAGLGPMRIYSIHLGHASPPERRRQIEVLMTILREAPSQGDAWSGRLAKAHWTNDGPEPAMPGSAMFLGDFNLEPDSPEYEMLVGEEDPEYGRLNRLDGLIDCWIASGHETDASDGITCDDDGRGMRIDYCFLTPDLADRVTAMRVGIDAQGSDHQPLYIDF